MTDVERFNRQQSVKWMHLPDAHRRDLVSELCKRDGVSAMRLDAGERFEFHGQGVLIFVEDVSGLT